MTFLIPKDEIHQAMDILRAKYREVRCYENVLGWFTVHPENPIEFDTCLDEFEFTRINSEVDRFVVRLKRAVES